MPRLWSGCSKVNRRGKNGLIVPKMCILRPGTLNMWGNDYISLKCLVLWPSEGICTLYLKYFSPKSEGWCFFFPVLLLKRWTLQTFSWSLHFCSCACKRLRIQEGVLLWELSQVPEALGRWTLSFCFLCTHLSYWEMRMGLERAYLFIS